MSEPAERIVLPPYARALGMAIERMELGAPLLACDYSDRAAGRPGFWHGGALAGLLEMAAVTAVEAEVGVALERLKPVNVTVQYLRGAPANRIYATGRVVRAGRRLVQVNAELWQDDREHLLATAQMNVILAAEAN